MRFRDRSDAGRRLAPRLTHLRTLGPVVIAVPMGGVPVAAEVADALAAELGVALVCKIGAPDRPGLAVGAVGEDGVTVRNDGALNALGFTWADVGAQVERAWPELRRRAECFRTGGRPPVLRDRTVILVDDGIATGSTVVAALRVVRSMGATWVVLAVPVAAANALEVLSSMADEVVCLLTPPVFASVGQWYEDFTPVTDDEVRALLGVGSSGGTGEGRHRRDRSLRRPRQD